MESVGRANARKNAASVNEQSAYEAVIIRTIDDIKKVIDELSPNRNNNTKTTTVSTVMTFRNDKNVKINQSVSAKVSEQSHRDMIMDGISVLRNRKEIVEKIGNNCGEVLVNGKTMKSPPVINLTSELPIDQIIGHVTGGYRDGEHICWDLDGYQYRFDIFMHNLTRVKHATDE